MGGKPGAADGAYRLASLNGRKPTSGRVPSVCGPVALVLREANTGKSGAGGYSIGPDRGKLFEIPPVAGAKRQRWTASDTAGNQEIGRLNFLYATIKGLAYKVAAIARIQDRAFSGIEILNVFNEEAQWIQRPVIDVGHIDPMSDRLNTRFRSDPCSTVHISVDPGSQSLVRCVPNAGALIPVPYLLPSNSARPSWEKWIPTTDTSPGLTSRPA